MNKEPFTKKAEKSFQSSLLYGSNEAPKQEPSPSKRPGVNPSLNMCTP